MKRRSFQYWIVFTVGLGLTLVMILLVIPMVPSGGPRGLILGPLLVAWAIYYHRLQLIEHRRQKLRRERA